jgi:hypothetical protein
MHRFGGEQKKNEKADAQCRIDVSAKGIYEKCPEVALRMQCLCGKVILEGEPVLDLHG